MFCLSLQSKLFHFKVFLYFFIENLDNFKVFTYIYAVLFTFVHNGASYMHARTDTYHSRHVYQRSLTCTQVHDHVCKIEIARYCCHEGVRKNAVRIDRITVRFRKKTSKKKKRLSENKSKKR